MDNTPSFKLGDGSVNDGYLFADGVHITRSAMNKLAMNLKLQVKDRGEGVCRNMKNRQNKQKVNVGNSGHRAQSQLFTSKI